MTRRRVSLLVLAAAAVAALLAFELRGSPDDAPAGAVAAFTGKCPGPGATFSSVEHPPGCWRPYSTRSPFNRRVPARPRLLENSDAIIRQVTGWGPPQRLLAGHADTPADYYHPIYWSRPGDPRFRVRCTKYGRCPVEGHVLRIPDAARPARGDDGHLTVINPRNGWEYDFWQVAHKPRGGGTLVVSYGGRTRIDGDGLGSNATAAWFGGAAGVIRGAEMQAGNIRHALFGVTRCTSGRSVYPAQPGTSGATCEGLGIDGDNALPMGARIWLDMPAARIERLRIPGWQKTILTALNRYGMIIGDTTSGHGSWGLVSESGSSFTSFGQRDPWADFASKVTGKKRDGNHALSLDKAVDWSRHLRVLDPCVSRGRC